jgi:hypothetical protein
MAHWHDFNPWADCIVYLPSMEEWAECNNMLGETVACYHADGSVTHELATLEWLIDHGLNNARIQQGTDNPKVDPYILPQPSGQHSLGLRIGPAPEQYQSPSCNVKKAQELIDKYGGLHDHHRT